MNYPDDNPKTEFGLAKCPIHLVPPKAIRGMAEAWANGAEKYGPFNWREHKISSTVYYGAAIRHLLDWYDRVDVDDCAPDSHVHHLKHAMACIGMIVDVLGTTMLNDNRPPIAPLQSLEAVRLREIAGSGAGDSGDSSSDDPPHPDRARLFRHT